MTITVKVQNQLMQILHWSLAIAFIVAYITEGELLNIHVWAGYCALGFLTIRIIINVIKSIYAKFTNQSYSQHKYTNKILKIALMLSLIITIITGMATYGAQEFAGPLAMWMSDYAPEDIEVFEELHEFFANVTLGLVALHIISKLKKIWIKLLLTSK